MPRMGKMKKLGREYPRGYYLAGKSTTPWWPYLILSADGTNIECRSNAECPCGEACLTSRGQPINRSRRREGNCKRAKCGRRTNCIYYGFPPSYTCKDKVTANFLYMLAFVLIGFATIELRATTIGVAILKFSQIESTDLYATASSHEASNW